MHLSFSTPSLCLVGILSAAFLCHCAVNESSRDKGLESLSGISASSIAQTTRPRRLALLVGVDHYQNEFWPALHFAAKDAEDLARMLGDPSLGAFDHVTVLNNNSNTKLGDLRRALDDLRTLAQHSDDTVLVYISSHGSLAPTPRGFNRVLIMQDTDPNALEQTGLTMTELEDRFAAIPSTRKALILASCHSGTGKSLFSPTTRKALQGLKGTTPALETVSHASLIFSAAAFGQTAREDDRLGHDVYTYYLLEALALGADANGDGAVTASEAHDYARSQTYSFTEGRQVPTLEAEIVGSDPVVLSGQFTGPGLPVLYSYAAGFEGTQLRVGGRDKGVFPGNLVVESGLQKIELLKNGEVLFSTQIRLHPGDRISATVLVDRDRPRWSLGARASGFALLDNQLNGQLIEPLLGIGLSLRLRDWPMKHLDPLVELSFAQAEQTVHPGLFDVPQSVQMLRFGLGAAAATDFWKIRFYAGPHLSLLYLNRTILLREPVEAQQFATLMPGGLAGLAWGLGPIELLAEAQLHYLPLMLNNQLRSVSTASFAAGAAWRF